MKQKIFEMFGEMLLDRLDMFGFYDIIKSKSR